MSVIKLASIPALLLVAVLTMAPSPQQPEKINIQSVAWDGNTQSFDIPLGVAFGPGTAGRSADFYLMATVEVKKPDGTTVALLTHIADVELDPAFPDPPRNDTYPAVPIKFHWDRVVEDNNGMMVLFSGPAMLSVIVELRNPAGHTMASQTRVEPEVTIDPGGAS